MTLKIWGSWNLTLFAGEHTTSEGTGCVHGAYMSGIYAADCILENIFRNDVTGYTIIG